MELESIIVKYDDVSLKTKETVCFRGYFANTYRDISEMHNHTSSGLVYKYPVVQYKVIDSIPMIVAIGDGVKIITDNKVYLEDELRIGTRTVVSESQSIHKDTTNFGISEETQEYEFISPWIALNNENQKKYKLSTHEERQMLLERVLTGNILSMCKSIGYNVSDKIHVCLDASVLEYNPVLKGQSMVAFKGKFKVNMCLPSYIGLGKSVSRGFGCIKSLNSRIQ